MSRNMPVTGGKEIAAYLSALPKNMQKNAVRAGLRAAANVIRDEAKLRAPKESGLLAKAIGTSSPRQNQDGTYSVQVRVRGSKEPGGNRHAFLGWFHEYGVRPHRISVSDETLSEVDRRLKPLKSGKARSRQNLTKWANNMERDGSLVINGNFVGSSVMHPGHAAHPFMRPALDAKADEAIMAFAARIREYLAGVQRKTGYDATAGLDEAA